MHIHELRKLISKNKKYKYIYQVIIDGVVIDEKKTSEEYNGCILHGIKVVTFFSNENIALVLSTFLSARKTGESIAITFNSLKNLKGINI